MALRIIIAYELLMSPLRKAVDGSHSESTHCRVRSVTHIGAEFIDGVGNLGKYIYAVKPFPSVRRLQTDSEEATQ